MLRSSTAWLVPIAFTLLGFGSTNISALAQTTYTFNATYDVSSSTSRAITPLISATNISGESTDAPYGLTNFSTTAYSQVDEDTGSVRVNANPATFGLQNEKLGETVLFGSGSNKLFGIIDATEVIDEATLSARGNGIFTITGGEGIFVGATGTLAFFGSETISLDPAVPDRGSSRLGGSFEVFPIQTVPEPRTTAALGGLSVIMVFLLQKHKKYLSRIR